jgi:hypothetical protein
MLEGGVKSTATRHEAMHLAKLAGEAIAKACPDTDARRLALGRLFDLCNWIDKQFGWACPEVASTTTEVLTAQVDAALAAKHTESGDSEKDLRSPNAFLEALERR